MDWDEAPDYTVVRADHRDRASGVRLIKLGGSWHILSRAGIYTRPALNSLVDVEILARPTIDA